MNLYEMTQTANYLYRLLEDGEIDEKTVTDSLEGLGVGDKLEDYCKVIRQFEADAEAYKAEKDRFAEKQKKAEKSIERLTEAIKNYMAVTGSDKQKCGVFDIKLSTSKKVAIVDEAKISEVYLKPQPAKIDVAAIRAELMNGGEVAGAVLQINTNIKIK